MAKQYIVICIDDKGFYVQSTGKRFDLPQALKYMKGVAEERNAVVVEVPYVELAIDGYPIKGGS